MGCAEPDAIDVRIGSRDAERVRVSASVDAVCADGTVLVLVHDLCVTGAQIETQQLYFQIGEVVRLRLPFLPVEQLGEIAWTRGALAGVRFSPPLDGATFRILTKVMKPPEPRGAQAKIMGDFGAARVLEAYTYG